MCCRDGAAVLQDGSGLHCGGEASPGVRPVHQHGAAPGEQGHQVGAAFKGRKPLVAVANPHNKILDAPPSNLLYFYAVFRDIWPNNRSPRGKFWIRRWIVGDDPARGCKPFKKRSANLQNHHPWGSGVGLHIRIFLCRSTIKMGTALRRKGMVTKQFGRLKSCICTHSADYNAMYRDARETTLWAGGSL